MWREGDLYWHEAGGVAQPTRMTASTIDWVTGWAGNMISYRYRPYLGSETADEN